MKARGQARLHRTAVSPCMSGARVAALATPGEVVVSRTVRDLVVGSEIEFTERGEHVLKGVPGTWQVFTVHA